LIGRLEFPQCFSFCPRLLSVVRAFGGECEDNSILITVAGERIDDGVE
jgi:hypothetical protein